MFSVANVFDHMIRIAIWGGLLMLFAVWFYELLISLRQARLERDLLDWWVDSGHSSVRPETRPVAPHAGRGSLSSTSGASTPRKSRP